MSLTEIIAKAVNAARTKKGHSLAQMGLSVGKADDTIARWEKGKVDYKLSDIEAIASYAGMSVKEMLFGKEEKKQDEMFELEIYTKEDRLKVATILLDNGYAVTQGKRQKTPTGKQVIYFLKVSKDPNGIVSGESNGS